MALIRGSIPGSFTVYVPGSKSIANRALVCSALANNASVVMNVPDGDDVTRMVECLQASGAHVSSVANGVEVSPGSVEGPLSLNCGLAGTTSRFMLAFALTRPFSTTVDGERRLRQRPMRALVDAVRDIGADVHYGVEDGHLPVTITPHDTTAREVSLRGDVSSQFLSALMLVAPRLGGLRIVISGDVISRPYIEMTAAVMRSFGSRVEFNGQHIQVAAGGYTGCRYVVEPDFSSAAFAIGLALLGRHDVTLPGLVRRGLQGDSFILDIAEMMGAQVVEADDAIVVSPPRARQLLPVDVDLSNSSDLVPIVAVLSLFAPGESRIRGVGFVREKESNRIDDLAMELSKCGAQVSTEADGLRLLGGTSLHGAFLGVHDDHRLAMAFSVLGSVVEGINIDDPDVVSKSWPSFWDNVSPAVSLIV